MRWLKNGQPVEVTRKVIVRAGFVTTVDFPDAVLMAMGGSGELVGTVQAAGRPIAGSVVALYAAGAGKPVQLRREKPAPMECSN